MAECQSCITTRIVIKTVGKQADIYLGALREIMLLKNLGGCTHLLSHVQEIAQNALNLK